MKINDLYSFTKDYHKETITIRFKKEFTLKTGKMITKITEGKVRLGLDYTTVVEPTGAYAPATPTIWAIKDFVKVSPQNNLLLMVYTTKNKLESKYLYESNDIELKDIIDEMYAKDKPKSGVEVPMFTINLDNLISLEK